MIDLEDLTKEELITLISTQQARFNRRDILQVRWLSLTERIKALQEDYRSIVLRSGIDVSAKYREIADSFWQHANKLQMEADKILEEMDGDELIRNGAFYIDFYEDGKGGWIVEKREYGEEDTSDECNDE